MVSLKNRSKGFTIVELLIVIVVIAILATLVIVTFTGIQQRARDSQRQTDVNAVASHLAAFYADKGFYPTGDQLKSGTWVAANLKGLDPEALIGPKGSTTNDQLTTGTDDGTGSGAAGDHYNYYATSSTNSGNPCATGGADDQSCDTFVLSAVLEKDNSKYVKKSN